MFIFSSILVYFFSIIIAISAMTFVVLLTISDEVSKRRQFFYLLCFCASNFLIETLYLCMTIQDSLLHYYHYNVFIRVFDTALYTLQSYSWCRYLMYFPSKKPSRDNKSRIFCNILAGISLILGIVTYTFLINNQFLFISDSGAICDLIISLLLSIMLICTAVTRRRSDLHFNRFNLLITFMLVLIQWWTSFFMIFETHTTLPFEIHEYLTGAAQQMFVILALAVYVYKTDYSGVTLRSQLHSLIVRSRSDGTTASTASISVDDEAPAYILSAPAEVSSEAASSRKTDAASLCEDSHISAYDAVNAGIGHNDSITAETSDSMASAETAAVSEQNKLNASDAPVSADSAFEAHAGSAADPHAAAHTGTAASKPGTAHGLFVSASPSAENIMIDTSAPGTSVSAAAGSPVTTPSAVSDSETSGSGIPNLNDIIARSGSVSSADTAHKSAHASAGISSDTYHRHSGSTLHTSVHVSGHQYDDGLSDIERIFDEKQLTRREREVARLAYTGLTNPEIADKLCISQHTVKRHMHSIFEKLNISARIELVHLMNRM